MHTLIERKLVEVAEICRRRHVRRLDVFGSAVKGNFDPDTSDVDFLVEFERVPSGHLADAYFGLKRDLEDLFQRRVDLVMDRAIVNPYFRASVDATDNACMRPESKKYLWDAREAADSVLGFVAGRTLDEYRKDKLLRSGVERQLGIVGEALVQLRRADPATAAAIPELAQIVGFRNILVHGYAVIDDEVVWDVIQRDLPALRTKLGELLEPA